MAGGKYTSMNKVIPGVYFAMQQQATEESLLSPNGVLAWVCSQPWGDTVEEISLDDYAKDKCYLKIGRHNSESHMVLFGQYCNKLICINPAQNRTKASATIIASSADSTQLYLKVAIKPTAPTLTGTGQSLKVNVASGKLSFEIDGTAPAGYKKTLSLEDLVADKDDVYVVETYKKVDSNFVKVDGADAYTNIEGALEETVASATVVNNYKWFGPSDSTGSLRCKQLIGGLFANANKLGSLGNEISIVVISLSDGRREVRTTVGGVVVDRQRISSWAKFVDNDYISLSGLKSGLPAVSSGINLSGGSDGVVTPDPIRSAAWTATSVDYRFVALQDNFDVDGMTISVNTASTKLVLSKVTAAGSTSVISEADLSSSNVPHVVNFDLEDGNILELKIVTTSGTAVADSTNIAASTISSALALSGGNHGVVLGLDPALEELKDEIWNVVVCEDQSEVVNKTLFSAVEALADERGKYRRMVHCNNLMETTPYNPYNSPQVVYLQQAMDGDAAMTAFCIAAMEAGCSFAQSATYAPIQLDGEPDLKLSDLELEDFIANGVMPISKRDDGVWCITKDISSLYELEEYEPEILKKNRACRCLDTFRNTCKYQWETKYAGQVTNNESGRSLWQDEVYEILSAMAAEEGIKEVSASDIVVMEGDNSESVITQVSFSIYDSMEIVYIQMAF